MTQSYPIGVLFSTTGPYALLGRDAFDGALMALTEINEDPAYPFDLVPLTGDPEGAADCYQTICDRLIGDGARHIVGGITSWSRKEMIPVVEKGNALLWYPCPYEGFECSDRVVYLGACPNQHIVPLFDHVVPRFGARAFLVGSNYIWGWETNRIARKLLEDRGGSVLGERYLPLGQEDVDRIVAEIEETRPDFILNTLIGPSSYAFLRALGALAKRDRRFAPDRCPVVSCNLAECELGRVGPAGIGQICTAVYFDSLDNAENRAFLSRVRRRLGPTRRVSAFFACAYSAVRVLAEAIRDAGSDRPNDILPLISSGSHRSPLGRLTVSARTRHTAFAPLLATIAPGNTFDIVEHAAEPIEPDPYLSRYAPAPIAASALESAAARPMLRVVGS
ncbi:MAG: transporter substrate-binding domain-containing protein [Hyphomicrobiales bacterium]|nr:transporter substrate-binding domain-containing protein [Hyphomicrobiales bacterium]